MVVFSIAKVHYRGKCGCRRMGSRRKKTGLKERGGSNMERLSGWGVLGGNSEEKGGSMGTGPFGRTKKGPTKLSWAMGSPKETKHVSGRET